jgi:hypothetical protein
VGPGYQYNTTWTNLPAGEIALDIRIDMRTFDDAGIANLTLGGFTTDPLTGAQFSLAYDATKLTFVRGDDQPTAPRLATATVNGSTPGVVNVLNGVTGNGIAGNVAVVRLVFTRAAGGTTGTTVGSTTTLQAATSRNAGATVSILANVVNVEGTYVLPAPLP